MILRFLPKLLVVLQVKLRKSPALAIVVLTGLMFLVGTGLFAGELSPVMNSPDENVNLVFSRQFAEDYSLSLGVSEVDTTSEFVVEYGLAPRSVSFSGVKYVPATFWGLPIFYGGIISVLGDGLVWYLTPLLIFLAGLAFYSLVKKCWGERVAMVSGVLFYLHPIVWLYSVRGLFNNELFLALLMFALWFTFVRPLKFKSSKFKKFQWLKIINDVLGFVFVGAALFVRAAEALWVIPGFILVWLLIKGWKYWVSTLTWIVLGLVPVVLMFGKGVVVFAAGYVINFNSFVQALFPFGLHFRQIATTVWQYLFSLSGFIFVICFLGGLYILFRLIKIKKLFGSKQGVYLLSLVVLLYPILLYGSWVIHDNPTVGMVTVGNSYMRYWLPVLVFIIPLGAQFLVSMFKYFLKVDKKYSAIIWTGFFVLWIVQSLYLFYLSPDAYYEVRQQNIFAKNVKAQVLAQVSEDSVLITDRWDKVFWPDRIVGRDLFSEKTFGALKQFVSSQDSDKSNGFYYFGLKFRDEEFVRLDEKNILANQVQEFENNHVLYELKIYEKELVANN